MIDNGGEFCDTSVIVYAYDLSAGPKRQRAKEILDRLWASGKGVIGVQVLQELYVTLTKKASPRLQPSGARVILEDLCTWEVVVPGSHDVLQAIDISIRWGLSFWDAMIITAAMRSGVQWLWSEDLQDGETYGGVLVRNPFST